METKHKGLDKGFIEILDSLGNDLTVANSARVSFGKVHKKLTDGDKKLINPAKKATDNVVFI